MRVVPPRGAGPGQPAPAAPASQVLLSTSSAGNWTSAPFQVTGSSPELKVTYSFSGNSLPGESSGDNFVLYVDSGSDMNLPPARPRSRAARPPTCTADTSTGDTGYPVQIEADGPWTVTITQVNQ